MRRRLLLVHDGPFNAFDVEAIVSSDVELFAAVDSVPDWLGAVVPPERVVLTDPHNSIRLSQDVTAFMAARGISFDGAGTLSETCVAETADLAAALELIGPDPGATRRSSVNKILMRVFCHRAGLRVTRFAVCEKVDRPSLEQAIATVGVPCVAKPISGSASLGVVKLESESDIDSVIGEVEQAWYDPSTKDRLPGSEDFSTAFIVEEFVSGPLLSVDGIIQDGEVHLVEEPTEWLLGPEPHFEIEGSFIPGRFDATQAEQCRALAVDVLGALGLDDTPFHCEQRLTDSGPVLIEIAARQPGGAATMVYRDAYGIDLAKAQADLWLGRKVDLVPDKREIFQQMTGLPEVAGVVTEIAGFEEAAQIEGVVMCMPLFEEGQAVVAYPDPPLPLWFSLTTGDTHADAEVAAQRARETITMTVSPDATASRAAPTGLTDLAQSKAHGLESET